MTPELRDLFAAHIAGHCEAGVRDNMDLGWWRTPAQIATRAYAIADAMIAVRSRGGKPPPKRTVRMADK